MRVLNVPRGKYKAPINPILKNLIDQHGCGSGVKRRYRFGWGSIAEKWWCVPSRPAKRRRSTPRLGILSAWQRDCRPSRRRARL
jgi:hypothetical protein